MFAVATAATCSSCTATRHADRVIVWRFGTAVTEDLYRQACNACSAAEHDVATLLRSVPEDAAAAAAAAAPP